MNQTLRNLGDDAPGRDKLPILTALSGSLRPGSRVTRHLHPVLLTCSCCHVCAQENGLHHRSTARHLGYLLMPFLSLPSITTLGAESRRQETPQAATRTSQTNAQPHSGNPQRLQAPSSCRQKDTESEPRFLDGESLIALDVLVLVFCLGVLGSGQTMTIEPGVALRPS
jgi:hypothetical protein